MVQRNAFLKNLLDVPADEYLVANGAHFPMFTYKIFLLLIFTIHYLPQ